MRHQSLIFLFRPGSHPKTANYVFASIPNSFSYYHFAQMALGMHYENSIGLTGILKKSKASRESMQIHCHRHSRGSFRVSLVPKQVS